MHIPDGFLSPAVWMTMWIISAGIIGYAILRTNKRLRERHVPLMGVLAAFIFAGQMLNVPIAAGTSGHLLGGVLSAIFLGPFAGSIVMSTVFIVQAVFFQDGGIFALGANIFNMGLIGTILGYYIYTGVKNLIGGTKGMLVGAGIAGWLAVVLASIATSLELGFSGTVPLNYVLPAMVGIHAIIGIIEAAITITVVAYVLRVRPDLLELPKV
ncbi:MAG: energy-coupling factor ABC transporter permease [Candidatus Hydrothermarchaeota archaeon]